jgi:hypothetical protein
MANGSFKEEIAERINTGIVSQLVRDAHKNGKCLRRGKYAYLKKKLRAHINVWTGKWGLC